MIPKGASGQDAELLINLFDASGNPILGKVWTGSTGVFVALPGAALVVASAGQLARIVEKGRGRYALQLSAAETATTGTAQLDLDTGVLGCLAHSQSEDVRDFSTAAIAAAVWATVLDAANPANAQTASQLVNILASWAFGQLTNSDTTLNGSIVVKNIAGTVTRLVGAVVAGVRTISAQDGR